MTTASAQFFPQALGLRSPNFLTIDKRLSRNQSTNQITSTVGWQLNNFESTTII